MADPHLPLKISPASRAALEALPVAPALPELVRALEGHGNAVLVAPPGAGKTTAAPLHLLEHAPRAGKAAGKIVMLEPRRLAARAAAERMAEILGEEVGHTVGYRMRGETVTSPATRIEVVTEGILTRMIQNDPELAGVTHILFDEFHERSIHADLALALAREVQTALREDLSLVVMSATMDPEPVARLLGGAAVIEAEGRSYPVEIRHLPRAWQDPARSGRQGRRMEDAFAALLLAAINETREGGILAFLPGEGEIRRVARLIEGRLPADIRLHLLYGIADPTAQRRAIRPEPDGRRKLVLATSIAETSLTIEGLRVVVDSGLARRARHDPASGMNRLTTERVSRAEAEQRAGRAGRTGPGICYRLWTRGEEGALKPWPEPEILRVDLAPLALEMALWGADDPSSMPFLDPPPKAGFDNARALLTLLGALDGAGRITEHGKKLAALPLHPRLGHMLTRGGPAAADLAALLEERDVLMGGGGAPLPADLSLRLEALRDPAAFARNHPWQPAHGRIERIRREAGRLRRLLPKRTRPGEEKLAPAALLALAWPDRIARRRPGKAPRFLMASGKGAFLPEGDSLGNAPFLAIAETDGDPREARIRLALPIEKETLLALFADRIREEAVCEWDERARKVKAVRRQMLGAVPLAEAHWAECPAELRTKALLEGVRTLGLGVIGFDDKARRLAARIEWARKAGVSAPPHDEAALLADLERWLRPAVSGAEQLEDIARQPLAPLLEAALDWQTRQAIDKVAPAHFVTPAGRKVPIEYGEEGPAISVRMQELYGLDSHPVIAGRPLRITLLSPAMRPLQTTSDLPRFWRGAYGEIRKEMRGRYPKHDWPEHPENAPPHQGRGKKGPNRRGK